MPCSSRLRARFSVAALATIAAACVTGSIPAFAAPPDTIAPAASPTSVLPTDAEIAAFYAPFGEKLDNSDKSADADSTFNAGVTYLINNDFRTGGAFFTSTLAVRPKFSDARFERALCSQGLQKWDFAITDLTAVITSRPRFYDGYVERARSYKMLGDLAKARADADVAKAIHPERMDIYDALGDPRPDLSLSSDATMIESYALRLPKGYAKSSASISSDIEDVRESVTWTGPARIDGSRPFIAIAFITPPVIGGKTWTAEGALTNILLHLRQSRIGWSQAQMQIVNVNSVPCAYATWSGKVSAGGAATRGFGYVAQDGDRFVYVYSQDTEPYAQETLAVANISALTLRKR